jgi:hypothetical protein
VSWGRPIRRFCEVDAEASIYICDLNFGRSFSFCKIKVNPGLSINYGAIITKKERKTLHTK